MLPPSALRQLSQLEIAYPMLFEITNHANGRKLHCGVLEFIANEGNVLMPHWMMQNLGVEHGDLVKVESATLPKGTFVKLRPQSKAFIDIANPKAVLENTLRLRTLSHSHKPHRTHPVLLCLVDVAAPRNQPSVPLVTVYGSISGQSRSIATVASFLLHFFSTDWAEYSADSWLSIYLPFYKPIYTSYLHQRAGISRH